MITGPVLSTVKTALVVKGDKFPARSVPVPAASVNPTVPSPVHAVKVTVRLMAPDPETATVQLAVPVLLSVMSVVASATDVAFVYVIK